MNKKLKNENTLVKQVKIFCKKHNMNYSKILYKFAQHCGDNKWEEILIENPYTLMDLYGVNFKRADDIAFKIGFPKDHDYRIKSFVISALEELSKGSTIINIFTLLNYMQEKLEVKDSVRLVEVVLKESKKYKLLDENCKVITDAYKAKYVTQTSWYNTEKKWYKLCQNVSKLPPLDIKEEVINEVLSQYSFSLNEQQNKAIRDYSEGLNILTGWGGTGKTFTTRAILDVLNKSKQTYTCLTPTGISSKVFSESTKTSSQTIHRKYYNYPVIDTDWLILDECSMYSIEHIRLILEMIDIENPPRLLLIGDVSQLVPISVGDPFYSTISLIKKGKLKGKITELTQIMRASEESFIPHLCKMFVGNNTYDNSVESKKDLAGVEFIKFNGGLSEQISEIIKQNNFSFEDTMVLIPQNVGDYGNNVVNAYLDSEYSNGGEFLDNIYNKFRKGSYCMNIKNNKDLDIFNGERIKLLGKENDMFVCKKIGENKILKYENDIFKESVQLSYATTIHKCQGITMNNIIFVASNKFSHMNTRELVYTGLSRASKKLIVLYDEGALYNASKKVSLDNRVTFLRKLCEL